MQPRILILYGTTEGQTRKIAGAIAETLRSEGADVGVRHWVKTHARELASRPTAFVSV